ncbi:MAG: SIMPL domain-containing protein [Flavobacterium sp.]|nr:SIMPL domain-containing protein [Flavobacterium sp.]
MKKITLLFILIISASSFSQTKNFLDLPYIETAAKVDTLVIPDRIYLNISFFEKDSKGKMSVEELENKMNEKLKEIGINTEKQLTLNDLASNYKKYFLKQQDVQKNKNYTLLVYNAQIAGKVILALEEIEISNVFLEKTEYSKAEEMILILKGEAILKAKNQAIAMTKPLNQKLGNAIYISDYSNNINLLNGKVSGIQIRGNRSLEKEKYEPINIEFEKIKIESEVKVTFKLE